MEQVLQKINMNYICLPEPEIKRNNDILRQIVNGIVVRMKMNNGLFASLHETIFYKGSFYDGVRVRHSEQVDIHLLLRLPKNIETTFTCTNIPSFVEVQLENKKLFDQNADDDNSTYSGLSKLLDIKGFLSTAKVKSWMQAIATEALNNYSKQGSEYVIRRTKTAILYARPSSSSSTFPLNIYGNVAGHLIKIDFDFVPCFRFSKDKCRTEGYREFPSTKKRSFFIVPKPLHDGYAPLDISDSFWRLSFQQQERELLLKSYARLKTSIRLLKCMHDVLEHDISIATYLIETVFLWEMEEKHYDYGFWNNSHSFIFMHMLQRYLTCIEKKNIPFYWNEKENLISSISQNILKDAENRLKCVIMDIKKNFESDPYIIAKYLLYPDELVEFYQYDVQLGKRAGYVSSYVLSTIAVVGVCAVVGFLTYRYLKSN